ASAPNFLPPSFLTTTASLCIYPSSLLNPSFFTRGPSSVFEEEEPSRIPFLYIRHHITSVICSAPALFVCGEEIHSHSFGKSVFVCA
ncbi:hypothetical protein BGW36DRAFT_457884, partial [Talaromyces proteolyticus]